MADFLLIHGSGHGAWCFRDLIPAIEAAGHTARAIDLPGHGDNPHPLADITLDLYRDAIIEAIDTPVTLVGHSMGGYPISAVAEAAPHLVTRLVYLCAYVPIGEMSLVDRRKEAPRQPLMSAVIRTEDGIGFDVDPGQAPDIFYQDCTEEQVAYALPRLCTQAIAPQAVAVPLGENYARVPRSYIRCTNDQTIPPEYQVTMTADWPAKDVYDIATGHSPFFAKPAELAQMLDQIVKEDA